MSMLKRKKSGNTRLGSSSVGSNMTISQAAAVLTSQQPIFLHVIHFLEDSIRMTDMYTQLPGSPSVPGLWWSKTYHLCSDILYDMKSGVYLFP